MPELWTVGECGDPRPCALHGTLAPGQSAPVTVASPSHADPENESCLYCGHPVWLAQIGAQRVWTHGTNVGAGSYGIDCPERITR